jgi:hypothetical protein
MASGREFCGVTCPMAHTSAVRRPTRGGCTHSDGRPPGDGAAGSNSDQRHGSPRASDRSSQGPLPSRPGWQTQFWPRRSPKRSRLRKLNLCLEALIHPGHRCQGRAGLPGATTVGGARHDQVRVLGRRAASDYCPGVLAAQEDRGVAGAIIRRGHARRIHGPPADRAPSCVEDVSDGHVHPPAGVRADHVEVIHLQGAGAGRRTEALCSYRTHEEPDGGSGYDQNPRHRQGSPQPAHLSRPVLASSSELNESGSAG